ncbi:hypothetical protein GCK72_022644 [Caenorhabditis remanei]|uniref:Uncharacterized protein n=1 Tax=Caenorhabditis remanei TaxID=31234 RepID=A0A6A5FUY0_CAERE|nr:hypothetical protein GCK72_022644 [Caenorhabditis remanei]KAF1746191.1 hypothetical protein GCK72_022644 [Caenorhabditis remanei]
MSPSKRTLPKIPVTKFEEPPMNVPGTSSNRSILNSVFASPKSGSSNSSPDHNIFENTPDRDAEKQEKTISTQTEELNSSERRVRSQTCPVDLPGPASESKDAFKAVRTDVIKATVKSRPGQALPVNNN